MSNRTRLGIDKKSIMLFFIIAAVTTAVYFTFTAYGAPSSDREFEAHLTAQGFPESYKEALRTLHAKYPNWIFNAQSTGLDWNDVVKNQSTLGKNLVASGSISSWKSIQAGAYNWDTSTWVGFDGASWVAASEEIIKYHLDPRNFLDEEGVFQFLTHTYNAPMQSRGGLDSLTQGTFLVNSFQEGEDTITYGDIIMDAAAESGVNPYVLAAMILQEQGSSGSSSISGTLSGYEGYYNFFNIEAYASGSMSAVQRGLWYAGQSGSYNRPWNTRRASIIGGANYYGSNYVKAGQDTFYLKKFNVVQGSNLYLHQYMSNVQGAVSEGKKLAKAYTSELKSMSLEFKIPVFNNMPESAVAIPAGTGSPNNLLSSLSVSGYSLTPTFNKDTAEYNLIVGSNVSSINISATAVDSKAAISGTGTVSLSSGTTSAVVTVKAENGTSKSYTINIARGSTSLGPGQPSISMSYTINENGYVTGLAPGTSKSDGLSKITVSNGSADIQRPDGGEVTGSIGTGNVIKVYSSSGSVSTEYTVLIRGDVNGDGVVNALDLLQLQKHLLGNATLEGIYAEAADVDGNGTIGALDLLKLQKDILGVEKLEY